MKYKLLPWNHCNILPNFTVYCEIYYDGTWITWSTSNRCPKYKQMSFPSSFPLFRLCNSSTILFPREVLILDSADLYSAVVQISKSRLRKSYLVKYNSTFISRNFNNWILFISSFLMLGRKLYNSKFFLFPLMFELSRFHWSSYQLKHRTFM